MPSKKRARRQVPTTSTGSSSFAMIGIGVAVCAVAMLIVWWEGRLAWGGGGGAGGVQQQRNHNTVPSSSTTSTRPMRLMREVFLDQTDYEFKTRVVTKVDPFAQFLHDGGADADKTEGE